MFKKVKNQKLYIQIVEQIQDLLIKGKLKKGDKLPPEIVLAQKFGASRATIREALSALEILGIIESKSALGNFIKLDNRRIEFLKTNKFKDLLRNHSPVEVLEARIILEPVLASLAARRRDEKDIKNLQNILQSLKVISERMLMLIDKKEINVYLQKDLQFHRYVAYCAHNSVLYSLYCSLGLMLKEEHWKTLKLKTVDKKLKIKKLQQEHSGVFEAILQGNAHEAESYMLKHLKRIKLDMFEE